MRVWYGSPSNPDGAAPDRHRGRGGRGAASAGAELRHGGTGKTVAKGGE